VQDVGAVDVATIERIATREAKQIKDQVSAEVAELKAQVAELAASLRAATATVTMMIEAIGESGAQPPGTRPPVPIFRPDAVDRACAADPAAGPQRITVDVFGRRLTEDVTPGSDPAQVWADMCTAVSVHAQRMEAGDAWQN
jgi:outer membrane murein-binding lipoprotein Lpp